MESSKPFNGYFVKASSLIESVIAITIIATCLLVAFKLYATILEGRPTTNDHRLKFQVERLMADMRLTPTFAPETYDFETYKIKKTVSDHEGSAFLKQVSYTIEQASDTVTYRFLILKENEE